MRLAPVQVISEVAGDGPVVSPGVGPRRRVVLLGALLPAGVLVLDPSGWSPFGPSKWLATSSVALAGAAVALWTRRLQVARRPMIAWLVLTGWLVVTAAVGLDPLYAWIGTPQRHFGVVTWVLCGLAFLAGQSLLDDEDARLVIGMGVVTAGHCRCLGGGRGARLGPGAGGRRGPAGGHDGVVGVRAARP